MAATDMAEPDADEPGRCCETLRADRMLDGQLGAATGAASLEHVTPAAGRHARHEAVLAQAWDSLGLPGPLQTGLPFGAGAVYAAPSTASNAERSHPATLCRGWTSFID